MEKPILLEASRYREAVKVRHEQDGSLELRLRKDTSGGTARNASVEAERTGDLAVGRRLTEAAAAVRVGLSNIGAGAFTGGESAAALLAVGVGRARLRDKVRAEGSTARGGGGSSRRRIIRGAGSRARATGGRAGGGRDGVGKAIKLSNKLGSGLDLGGSEGTTLSTCDTVLEAESGGDVTVGGTVIEAAATITVGLSDVRAGALAGGEGAATLLALGVVGARLRDEARTKLAGLDGHGQDLELGSSEGKNNSGEELHGL